MAAIETIDGYVLHRRPWRESSLLIDCFSRTHGRIGLVARGGRSDRSPWRGLVEPFMPLSIRFVQKGEMGTVRDIEALGDRVMLNGEALMCGLYANELLLSLIDRQEAVPELFDHYEALISGLALVDTRMAVLRRYEWQLLTALGVAPSLTHDAQGGQVIERGRRYRLEPEAGFVEDFVENHRVVDGQTIAWLAGLMQSSPERDSIDEVEANTNTLKQARWVTRTLIDHQLGGRTLKTREMMRALR